MVRLTVQYLEDRPGLEAVTAAVARERLREAFAILPITDLVVGWRLPVALLDVCREEATRAGARFYRWQLVLAGHADFDPPAEWRAVGLDGEAAPAFRGMREFTFLCPHQPEARRQALAAVADVARRDVYDGVMLDRIRFPSPCQEPERSFACFCDACRDAFASAGLDQGEVRAAVRRLFGSAEGSRRWLEALLSGTNSSGDTDVALLNAFLDGRQAAVTALVREAVQQVRAAGKAVALDVFSPVVTRAVGQDLRALASGAGLTKLMVYGGTVAPAGLPFEILGLADWLVEHQGIPEATAMGWLREATGLPLPDRRATLRHDGLSPEALAAEVARAHALGLSEIDVGIDLVHLDGVTCAGWTDARLREALVAFRDAGVSGLVLSWDLWFISTERLRLVADVFAG
ncbi:MAG TPA: hypothetical protein VIL01_12115 [Thermomicrobiales bacterium]